MNLEQLVPVREVIGDQNCEAVKRALEDEALIWIFQSPEEAELCADITDGEKAYCRNLFSEGEKWAGIVRSKPKPPVPGFTPSPELDTHGNSRGGGGSSGGRPYH